jgi:hypothetical protein
MKTVSVGRDNSRDSGRCRISSLRRFALPALAWRWPCAYLTDQRALFGGRHLLCCPFGPTRRLLVWEFDLRQQALRWVRARVTGTRAIDVCSISGGHIASDAGIYRPVAALNQIQEPRLGRPSARRQHPRAGFRHRAWVPCLPAHCGTFFGVTTRANAFMIVGAGLFLPAGMSEFTTTTNTAFFSGR